MSSNKVDERVVEMSFENQKFEKGVSESSNSLSKFNSQLEKSGKGESLTGLTGVVEGVSSKFSALETIGVGALLKIGEAAVNLGTQLIKSIAIDPVMQGFNEYELKINSIRTMLASGKTKEGLPVTLAEVNAELDELNHYADKTIYSFSDMTSNIGKFTNAGVDLKTSVEAIKGISNEAALSGANANEASRAMYNFAQALSAGYVKLIDWKSIENANMATVEFKQYLLDAAVACGTVKKSADGMYHVLTKNNQGKTMDEAISSTRNFNDSLQYQWMTTQVLTDTLSDYASETTTIGKKANEAATKVRTFSQLMDTTKEAVGSGWTESFELLIGNYDEATNFWTGLSQSIGDFVQKSSDARNKFISDWVKAGGRSDLIAGFKALGEAIMSIIKPIHDAFTNIFPPLTGKQLADFTHGFKGLMESLKLTPDASDKVKRAFEGLFSIIKLLVDGIKNLIGFGWDLIKKIFPGLSQVSGGALDAAAHVGDFLSQLSKGVNPIKNFNFELKDLGSIFDKIKEFISDLIHGKGISDSFVQAFSGIPSTLKTTGGSVTDFGQTFKDNMGHIQDFISMVKDKLLPAFDWIKDKLGQISLKQVAAVVLGLGLIKFAKTILGFVNPISDLVGSLTGVLGSASKAIKSFSLNLKAEALFTIAKSIALLAATLVALSLVPADKLKQGLGALTILIGELVASLLLMSKIKDPVKMGAQIAALSAGVLLLSGALLTLGAVPFKVIEQGTLALSALLVIIIAYGKVMQGTTFAKASAGMISFGLGLTLMAGALVILGKVPFDTLAKGIAIMSGLMTIMVVYSKLMSGSSFAKSSAGLIGFGVGLIAMAGALVILGKIPFKSLAQGSVALVGLLSSIALFVTMTNGKDLAVTGGSLIGLGAGLLALSGALAVLGKLPFDQLLKGGVALAGLMAGIGLFVDLTNGKDLAITAKSMIAFASGIAILAGVIAILTALDTGDLFVTTAAISGLIVAVGAFSKFSDFGSLAKSAAGLAIFAVALAALSVPIKLIAELPWQQLAATAGVIGVSMGSFALIAAVMPVFASIGPLIAPALVGIAGVTAIIAAIGLVVAGFGALASIPGVTELISGGGQLLMSIGTALGGFIGGIVGGFAEGVSSALPQIGKDLSDFMINAMPFIIGTKMVDASAVAGVKALAETILILTAANLLEGLTSWFTGGSSTSMADFGKELANFAPYFVSFYNQIKNVDGKVIEASANAAKALAEFANNIPNSGGLVAKITGENSITQFAQELQKFGPALMSYAKSVTGLDAAVVTNSANAAKALAEMATNLPNQGGWSAYFMGDNTLSVFGNELVKFGPSLKAYALSVAGLDADVVANSASAAKVLSEMATNLPNQGGIVTWFTGDNTLSKFGAELVLFGPQLAQYASSISTVGSDAVTNSANAAKALAEMMTNLPSTGGMEGWFDGSKDLGSFGQSLIGFGSSLSAYYQSIKDINIMVLSSVTSEFKNLIDVLKGASSINNKNLSAFSQNLTVIAQSGINGFINAFTGSLARVSSAAGGLVDAAVSAISSRKTQFSSTFAALVQSGVTTISGQNQSYTMAGTQLAISLNSGITSQSWVVSAGFGTILSNCLSILLVRSTDFYNAGKLFVTSMSNGIDEGKSLIPGVISNIVSMAVSSLNSGYSKFYDAGKYLVTGFANGITDNTFLAAAKAQDMAKAADKAARKELREASPSKEGFEIGNYFGEGFVNGIVDYVDVAKKTGSGLAKSAKDGLNKAIAAINNFGSDDFDSHPVITPILDLSKVQEGVGTISAMMSQNQALSISDVLDGSNQKSQNGSQKFGKNVKFEFNQTNYSPKALSRLEIYRQSKNQFSQLKGVVDSI